MARLVPLPDLSTCPQYEFRTISRYVMFNIVIQYQYVQAPLRSMVMRSWCLRMDGILALLADIRTMRSSYAYLTLQFCTTVCDGPLYFFCSGYCWPISLSDIMGFAVFFYPIFQWKEKWRPNGSAANLNPIHFSGRSLRTTTSLTNRVSFCHRNCIKMLLLSHKKHIYT